MGLSNVSPLDAFLQISYSRIYLCPLLILLITFLFKAFTYGFMSIFIDLSSLPFPCTLAVLYINYINTEILKPKGIKGLFGAQALLSDLTDCLGFLYF